MYYYENNTVLKNCPNIFFLNVTLLSDATKFIEELISFVSDILYKSRINKVV